MKYPIKIMLSIAAAGALGLGVMAPASAAVTYSSRQGPIGQMPAIDASTNTIYSVFTDTVDPHNSHLYLTAVSGSTLKTIGTYTIYTFDAANSGAGVTDLRVNARTHTVWFTGSSGKGGSYVQQINGTTMQLIREYSLGGSYAGTLSVDPAIGNAYVAGSPNTTYGSDDLNTFVRRFDANTGAVTTLDLPGDTSETANTAWDSANSAVYVVQAGKEYAVSSKLRLASTLTLPAEAAYQDLFVTADGTTHTVYIAGARLYSVAGTTNTVSRSVALDAPGQPVIDPGINTVYVGTGVYSAATLARTGTLPHPATSVNGPTHAIYAAGTATGNGWVISRTS